jgi:acyl-CoA hydrolase
MKTGNTILTNKAFISFVALGDDGKSTEVPPLILETEEERLINKEAEKRREYRLKRRSKE